MPYVKKYLITLTNYQIISTSPNTVDRELRNLIVHPEKRTEIGRESRDFAIKWHSSANAAKHFHKIHVKLLRGNKLLLRDKAYET